MPNTTFSEITPKNWTDAKRIGSHLRFHVFRGQADADNWHITTTLERVKKQYSVSSHWLPELEKIILKHFKSRAHHYIQSTPDDNNNIEWLALIREHGGPTRLLDVTWSFYIASFFAIEDASGNACVWAINTNTPMSKANANEWIERNAENKNLDTETLNNNFAESFLNNDSKIIDFVMPITPTRLSERQVIQQGVFLFPCNSGISFEQNLANTFGYHPNAFSEKGNQVEVMDYPHDSSNWFNTQVLKINLPRDWHKEIIGDLYQMNIDAASLFPGLDGFARSLKFPVRIRENTESAIDEILKHIPQYKQKPRRVKQ